MAKTNVDLEKTENMDELVENELEDMTNTSVENILHLTKPVMYNGEEVTELAFDFDKLTGADALNIEEELVVRGDHVLRRYQRRKLSYPYGGQGLYKACRQGFFQQDIHRRL